MIANLESSIAARLQASPSQIAEFCDRWKITEMWLFGSVLREDFRPDSDIDFLVTFAPSPGWSLFDLMDMEEELKSMCERDVDIANKKGLKNPYRRREILGTCRSIYSAELT
ncbi:MAG: nucleotidyltransferase family protein [Cyanobacteria bacterium P01_A01_bin.116]